MSLTIASPASMTLGSAGLRQRAVNVASSSSISLGPSERIMTMSCPTRRNAAPNTRVAAAQSMTKSFSAACIASAEDGLSVTTPSEETGTLVSPEKRQASSRN